MARHCSKIFMGLALAALLVAGRTSAQMIPLVDERETYAKVWFPGYTGGLESRVVDSNNFAPFNDTRMPSAHLTGPCTPGEPDVCIVSVVDALAGQISVFFPAGIQMSGETAGGWGGEDVGNYEFKSLCRFRFRVDTTFDYELEAAVTPGDWPSLGRVGGYVALYGPDPNVAIHYTQFGTLHATGRLPAGEYTLEGISDSGGPRDEDAIEGASYNAVWVVSPVTDSIFVSQPLDQTVGCGGTATFSVAAAGPPGTVTYQWMRNFQPLTNGSGVSGATSPTLTIQNVCTAQAGYYSVVVTLVGTNPPVQVPSRLAQLNVITTTTAVGEESTPPSNTSRLAPATPNPFRASTGIRYDLGHASTHLRAKVYDARGAEVRTLEDRAVSGSGTLTWDGLTRSGVRAPAGVYFVRVEAGDLKESKKVVLLP